MEDFGNIIYRPDTKAYVIRNNTYTVPHPDDETVPAEIHAEFDALYAEVDAYAKEHPDMVTNEGPLALSEEEQLDALASSVRTQRDSLLAQTDYLLMPDYPITEENLVEIKAYRQALRDIPEQEGFPENVIWPVVPAILHNYQ